MIIIIDMLLTCCKIDNGEIQSDMCEGNLRKRQNRRKRAIPMNHSHSHVSLRKKRSYSKLFCSVFSRIRT